MELNLVVPGVLEERFSGANQPDLVVEDINKVPCFVAQWTDAPVAVIIPHLFGTTAFQEANAVVASHVVLLEKFILSAYGALALPRDLRTRANATTSSRAACPRNASRSCTASRTTTAAAGFEAWPTASFARLRDGCAAKGRRSLTG